MKICVTSLRHILHTDLIHLSFWSLCQIFPCLSKAPYIFLTCLVFSVVWPVLEMILPLDDIVYFLTYLHTGKINKSISLLTKFWKFQYHSQISHVFWCANICLVRKLFVVYFQNIVLKIQSYVFLNVIYSCTFYIFYL